MKAKDIESLRALYVASRQQLYTYAVSITGNREAAEDAIHGVFERLLRGGGLPADVRPYLFRAVRNAALDSWRRAQVRGDSVFEDAPDDSGPGSRPDDLAALLAELPGDEREAIVLKIYGGLSFQEIADLRDAPLPTVASWYRRGLERLRGKLTAEL